MTSQHPTIPGVRVREYTERDWFDHNGKRISVRARQLWISVGRDSYYVTTNERQRTITVDSFPAEHTETVVKMIEDQAQWLREVGQ